MKWFLALSSFTCIIAIAIAAFYTDNITPAEYMRSFFSRATNNVSRTLKTNASNTHSTMSPSSTFVGLPVIPPNDPSLTAASPKSRGIAKVFEAIEQAEGAGATVRRSIGTPKLRNFSPFLMLDHFSIAPGAGFPDHPHRGQETVTYLLSGAVDHEDFAGNKGTIEAGDLQFMTAGRGIVHAEMPHDNGDGSSNVGMQLWVDLPRDLKQCEPRYRDVRSKEIPVYESEDGKVTVKVISGQSHGVDSLQELAYTPVWLLDVTVRPGGSITQALRIRAEWSSHVGHRVRDEASARVPQHGVRAKGRQCQGVGAGGRAGGEVYSCGGYAAGSADRAVRPFCAERREPGPSGSYGLPELFEWV
jgi:redox-sensitive bicupin YhaK (pirin superfamily)